MLININPNPGKGVPPMSNAVFPATVFTTQRCFNDFSTDDMRYGDMPEDRLKKEFGLNYISNVVDPYNLNPTDSV